MVSLGRFVDQGGLAFSITFDNGAEIAPESDLGVVAQYLKGCSPLGFSGVGPSSDEIIASSSQLAEKPVPKNTEGEPFQYLPTAPVPLNGIFLVEWNRRGPVDQVTCSVGGLCPETLVHMCVGQHTTSLRDDGSVHALGHTIHPSSSSRSNPVPHQDPGIALGPPASSFATGRTSSCSPTSVDHTSSMPSWSPNL